MPLLFSYGTLQDVAVQVATFGRRLRGERDRLKGYHAAIVVITDPAFVRASGSSQHTNAVFDGQASSSVQGTVYDVTEAELEAADHYERPAGYVRVLAPLMSGKEAWVFVHEPLRG